MCIWIMLRYLFDALFSIFTNCRQLHLAVRYPAKIMFLAFCANCYEIGTTAIIMPFCSSRRYAVTIIE